MIRSRARRTTAALGVVLALLLSACGSAPGSQNLVASVRSGPVDELGLLRAKPYAGTHLRFLICCNSTSQFVALRQRTGSDFTRRTGITVEWANIPYESYLQKIVAESAIGSGTYDIVAWPDAFGASAKVGLQPLNAVMRKSGMTMDDFPPPFRQAATAGTPGTTYGLPFRGYSYNLFYRKDQYDRLGLTPPRTWDEFSQQLEVLKRSTSLDPFAAMYGRNSGQNLFTWLSMLWSNGGEVLDAKGEPAFDSPQGIEATQQYISLLRKGYSPPESTNWTETEATQSFEQSKSSSVLTWAWQWDDFTDPGKVHPDTADNVAVAAPPGWPGKPTVTYGYTWLAGVLDTSEHQGAAWEYLKWLTHRQTERKVALDKSNPDRATSVVVHRSNMLDEQVNAVNGGLPRLQEALLRDAKTIPLTIDWPQIQDALEVAINEMAHGADVRTELAEAAAKIRSIE